jgi:hypothetical protein
VSPGISRGIFAPKTSSVRTVDYLDEACFAMGSDTYYDGSITGLLLQPYIDSITSTNADGAKRAVIAKLLQDPELFSGYNRVKSILGASVDPKMIRTLDLFSYGAITDYYREPESYMVLTEPQLNKLRQLTALSVIQNCCRNHERILPYRSIYEAAFLPSPQTDAPGNVSKQSLVRETEQLLAPLIATRMVTGKFSQRQESLILGIGSMSLTAAPSSNFLGSSNAGNDVRSSSFSLVVQSRDVPPDVIPSLVQSIQGIRTRLHESNLLMVLEQPEDMQIIESEPKKIPDTDLAIGDPMIVDDPDARPPTILTAKRSRDGSSGVHSNE